MTSRELVAQFKDLKVGIVGDLMLDEYVFGDATRISPEAPVMVVRHRSTRHVPGGAANVARNVAALGAHATVFGVVGDDEAGHMLQRAFAEAGIAVHHVTVPGRRTTRKTRIIADHSHQVLRLDAEDDDAIGKATSAQLGQAVQDQLASLDVLIFSDYLKGTLTSVLCQSLIPASRAQGVFVAANPKPRSLSHFRGADLVSLNRVETSEAAGLHRTLTDDQAVDLGQAVRAEAGVETLLVTLGGSGLVALTPAPIHVGAPRVEVADPAGAGDTIIATAALGARIAGPTSPVVYETAVYMASRVVQHVGVAVPSPEDLAGLP